MAEPLSLARHIFLTGEKQVGKEYPVAAPDCPAAVALCRIRNPAAHAGRAAQGLHPARPGGHGPCQQRLYRLRAHRPRKSVPVLDVFNENGVEILRRSLDSDAPFLLMDELGKLERQAEAFCSQVRLVSGQRKARTGRIAAVRQPAGGRKLPPVQTLRCYG